MPAQENIDDSFIEINVDNESEYRNMLYNMEPDIDSKLDYDGILKLYEEYLLENNKTKNLLSLESELDVENDLEKFAQYAVERGIIEDTPQAIQSFTVEFLRAQFRTAASIGESMGAPHAANFLRHSLQDNPINVSFNAGTVESDWILNSAECQAIINNFKNHVKGSSSTLYTTSGSTTLNSTRDLHLALNKVSYVASGTKNSSGVWTLNITFTDTYNFEKAAWLEMSNSALVTIINNYAVYAQEQGAIVPYGITIKTRTTF